MNPFRIRPAERLNLEQLLNRYLDWALWNRSQSRGSSTTFCDLKLHNSHLCCQKHMDYSHESDDFIRYFRHLGLWKHAGFSATSMKALMIQHEMKTDVSKVLCFWGMTTEEWASVKTLPQP